MNIFKKSPHDEDQKVHFELYKRYPITLEKGFGARVWDTEGREYIDMLAGIAVNNIGHCHPKLVEAIADQAGKLMHISNFYTSVPQVELAKKLTKLTGLDRAFFCNSGAEAIEAAIKATRVYGHKNGKSGNIITMDNCFHGRTLGTISAGKRKYQEGFDPMLPGFKPTAFNDYEALEKLVDDQTIGILIETIQGEGGIVPAEKEFLKKVRKLCDDKDIVLILDEIQCGIARTGKMFAYEHYGVVPDIVALAKGLGGGFPIGAIVAKEKISKAFEYGQHGTTFGGNPLATRAALETLKIIEDEKILDKTEEDSAWFTEELREWAQKEDSITDIRGKGFMIGIELDFPGAGVVGRLMHKGILANCASGNVIRLVPPLTISRIELTAVLVALKEAVSEEKKELKKA